MKSPEKLEKTLRRKRKMLAGYKDINERTKKNRKGEKRTSEKEDAITGEIVRPLRSITHLTMNIGSIYKNRGESVMFETTTCC